MNPRDYLSHGWTANPVVLTALIAASFVYARLVGGRGRPGLFIAAVALSAVAFLSPLDLLARGVVFSAHMTQHILLLLVIPALVLLSMPTSRARAAIRHARSSALGASLLALGPGRDVESLSASKLAPTTSSRLTPLLWLLGVGAMWLWHAPQLCNAAATVPVIHGIQSLSLLAMGGAFWWPILSPRSDDRLQPGHGIIYLFTACLACTGLGILITLSPVEVCPAFRNPSAAPAMWVGLRDQLTFQRDQQIGGLLMWLPMCLVYVAGIVLELARWFGDAGRSFGDATPQSIAKTP